ncbi:hypothetical protein NM688_g3548 [Phlebia brevispora]|uniref:Uncharacterized protein n=1 Tax=Phlebia brevispora TaxID=194682 RepID=A0ACC1T5M4_9APHY|nr:hypothetical protein NM688_g3548 [Phlebia brevispora]
MFNDISLPMQGLLIAWITAVLYGCNAILSIALVKILARQSLNAVRNRVFLFVALIQIAIATAHVATCLRMAMDGLIVSSDRNAYYGDQATPAHLAQIILFYVNNLIADGLLIWRLYVVWNKNYMLCIPFVVFLVTSAVCGFENVAKLSLARTRKELLELSLQRWAFSAWSLSIIIQTLVSFLLAYKIWTTRISTACVSRRHRHRRRTITIIWAIIESGSILCSLALILLAFYAAKKEIGAIVIAVLAQVDTLVPTSILIRVSLCEHRKEEDTSIATRPIISEVAALSGEDQTNAAVHLIEVVEMQGALDAVKMKEEGEDLTLGLVPVITAVGKRAVPDARLGDLDTLVSSFKQAQLDPRMPLRPGFGTLGKEVSLRSNFLALKLPKGMPIYEYTVTIQRKDDSDKGKSKGKGKGKGKARAGPEGDDGNRERKLDSATKARIFELLESSPQCAPYADYMVHDESGHLVSSQQLPAPLSISVHYAGEGDNEAHGEYVVEIKPRSTFNTDDIVPYLTGRDRGYPVGPFISALNLVFRRQALKNNAVSVGQNKYFFPTVEATPLAIGLEARRGYFMSVRPTFKTLMVNVNVSFAAFYSISGNLAEEMRRLEADNRGRRVSYEFLVGLRVETTHLGYRKTRPITAVEFKTARQASFYCKELGGQVTVENYFRQKYGKLKYPDLPVLNLSMKTWLSPRGASYRRPRSNISLAGTTAWRWLKAAGTCVAA